MFPLTFEFQQTAWTFHMLTTSTKIICPEIGLSCKLYTNTDLCVRRSHVRTLFYFRDIGGDFVLKNNIKQKRLIPLMSTSMLVLT